MSWNDITRIIEEFWNKPVPIIGFTVGALIIGVLLVIAKTSIGKKALNELKQKYAEIKDSADAMKNICDKLLEEKDDIIAKMTEEYENKLAMVQEQRNKEREVIIALGKCINNVKVQKIIEEYEKIDVVRSVSEYVESVKEKYDAKYEEVLKRLEELENGKVQENTETIEE